MADSLEHVLARHGATMSAFHGRSLPARFGDVETEWRAAREGCAVFDAGFRSFIHATGSDRVSFLQGMLSNDVKTLAPGDGMHAAFLTQQAKLVSDMRVYAHHDRVILDALALRADALAEGLERFLIADDVELVRSTDESPLLGLEGPATRSLVEMLFGKNAAVDTPYHHEKLPFEGSELRLIRVSEVAGNGCLFSGPPALAAALFEKLRAGGATPIGMDALNVLRVEGGVPWAGVDMDENVLLMEVGLDDAVSYKKGCYLGQEVVERVSARGHVNRKLTGLVLEGSGTVASGSSVFNDDADTGWTVSSVESFGMKRPIALAYLRREVLEPGTRLQVASGESRRAATVHALPFTGAAA